MIEPKRRFRGLQRAVILASLIGALGCATTGGGESTRGTPLSQVVATSDVPRVGGPAPDLMSSIVFATKMDAHRAAVIEKFRQWCRDSPGKVSERPDPADCPNMDAPSSRCFAGAAMWYAHAHPGTAYYHEVCSGNDGIVSAALLTTSRDGVPGGNVAVYERQDAVAFVRKYLTFGENVKAASEASAAERKQNEQRDFEAAIAKLDTRSDPALRDVPSARESIDFIREKLSDSGFRRVGSFTKDPCVFEAHPEGENPSDIDLKRLDLSVLDALAERHVEWHGDMLTAYRVVLKVGSETGYSEYKNPDAARRSARAFGALARRCGAKLDNRFR